MSATIAFFLSLSKLLLVAILVWGLIEFLPIIEWMKNVARVLLLLIVILSVLSDAAATPISQGSLPYPLNPSSPEHPSRVR